jgi:transposase
VLAAMPGFGGPRLDPVHIPAARSHALQRLTKQRGRFQDRIAASKRRLIDLVRWASPALERVLPDLRTRLALALLRQWLDPDTVLAARKSVIVRSIARNASGNHPRSGPFVDALVEGLRHAAREARVLHRTHVDFVELQAEVTVEVDAMLADIKAVSDLDRRIEVLYAELQPNDVLRSIPGVGQHLAPVLIGVLHTADRFRSERHIRGFCGLFPRRADSGGAERPGQRITQGGNNRIKRALMLAADTARKIDPELAEVYWRLMTVRGHHHKQALGAVANRLVNRILSVLRRGKPYGHRSPALQRARRRPRLPPRKPHTNRRVIRQKGLRYRYKITSRRRLASRPSSITGRRSGSSPPSNSSTCSSKRRQRA